MEKISRFNATHRQYLFLNHITKTGILTGQLNPPLISCMTLRKRLFWLFLTLSILVLLAIHALTQYLLLPRLDHDDQQTLQHASLRLQESLEQQGRYLLPVLETYALHLAQGPTEKPPAELDFVLHLNTQQQPNTLYSRLPLDLPRLAREQNEVAESPTISLDWFQEQPLILLSLPLASGGGWLLAGQRIHSEWLLEQLRDLPTVTSPDATAAHLHFLPQGRMLVARNTQPASTPSSAIQLNILGMEHNEHAMHTVLQLHTPQSRHGLYLHLSLPRLAYLESKRVLQWFLLWTLLVSTGALLVGWLCVEYWLMRRVRFMHREIATIGLNAQASRLSTPGRDELTRLGHSVNRMLDRLDSRQYRDQAILDSIDDGYFELGSDGRILTVSRGLERQLNFRAEELQGSNLIDVLGADELQRLRQQFRQTLDGQVSPRFVVPIRRRNGSTGYFETRVSLIRDAQGRYCGLRGMLHDIGDQVAFQEQLYDLAHRDTLTGMGNRMAFTEQLNVGCEEAMNSGRSLALLYLDLDRFKEVNDRFGHAIGDALLVAISERMRATVRQPDLLYRLGGDEFTLLLPDADTDMAVRIAQRLRNALAQPYSLSGQRIDFVLPSIGIALYPQHGETPDALINAADEAMYQAKLDGLGQCVSQASPVTC